MTAIVFMESYQQFICKNLSKNVTVFVVAICSVTNNFTFRQLVSGVTGIIAALLLWALYFLCLRANLCHKAPIYMFLMAPIDYNISIQKLLSPEYCNSLAIQNTELMAMPAFQLDKAENRAKISLSVWWKEQTIAINPPTALKDLSTLALPVMLAFIAMCTSP